MPSSDESRRTFFQKTAFLSANLSLASGLAAQSVTNERARFSSEEIEPEWRNKREGMSYRMLGRSGMMVSELVMGSFPFNDESYYPSLDAGRERGMNYLDTASSYSGGRVETALGHYLQQRGCRDELFLATKLSSYYRYLDDALREVSTELTGARKKELRAQADQMIAQREVLKAGYHFSYFGAQASEVSKTYYRHLLLKEHGTKPAWRKKIRERAQTLLEKSLKRLQSDYVDVLHCPHGLAMPEMLDDDLLPELIQDFKSKGLIRAAGVSFHNDVAGNLAKVIEVDYIDVAMFAYNIANHAALDSLVYRANDAGIGLIAMKVAKLFTFEDQPEWRKEKLDRTLPDEELSPFAKAYLWALQNPNLSCCVAQMETPEEVADNFGIVGKKVELQPV